MSFQFSMMKKLVDHITDYYSKYHMGRDSESSDEGVE